LGLGLARAISLIKNVFLAGDERVLRGKQEAIMSKKPSSGPAAALHKVIMVGSGGVGKSAVSNQTKVAFSRASK
jgi:hypothetical protein